MPLPDPLILEIAEAKLSGYLLSPNHPVGRLKARWFLKQGFASDSLRAVLQGIARNGWSELETETEHGTKYVIRGSIVTPTGASATLKTVWMRPPDTEELRFATAYPCQ